jgi:hypothetical protein
VIHLTAAVRHGVTFVPTYTDQAAVSFARSPANHDAVSFVGWEAPGVYWYFDRRSGTGNGWFDAGDDSLIPVSRPGYRELADVSGTNDSDPDDFDVSSQVSAVYARDETGMATEEEEDE